jgi:DNA mismatch repair protein MutL
MPRIHILPDQLISQIAAGEVVERPASIVKELVENALDAGATSVSIELEAGGKRRIQVTDDGSGMGKDDALLAFDRHATSKIAAFADLEQVATLGFRGEALASIAAVARVELITAEAPGEGQRVRIEGGRVRSAEPVAAARGTRIEVASLFFNTPARRAFLKSPETELRRALEVVQGYALARPEVGFRVQHEGRTVLETAPAPGAAGRSRIGQLFGASLAASLFELHSATGEVAGFVGGASTARGRRQFVFVNRRLVRDRAVMATFYRAVREEWGSEDFPALFLFLNLPPEEVDVNVHPQKAEVRFRDVGLLDRLGATLRSALGRALGTVPAPLGFPEFGAGQLPGSLAWQGLGASPSLGAAAAGEIREPNLAYGALDPGPPRIAEIHYAPLDRLPVPLSGRGQGPTRFRLLGQYKATLLLLEGPDGLYLVDQHVAHERILYERLRRAMAAEAPASQLLLTPKLLELGPAESLRLAELAGELEGVGFGLSVLSGGTLALSAVPVALSESAATKLLIALAGSDETSDSAKALSDRVLSALAASLACKGAIKMHHPLQPEAMEALVSELFAAEQPFACPHGRPIVLRMGDEDLERRFGRR